MIITETKPLEFADEALGIPEIALDLGNFSGDESHQLHVHEGPSQPIPFVQAQRQRTAMVYYRVKAAAILGAETVQVPQRRSMSGGGRFHCPSAFSLESKTVSFFAKKEMVLEIVPLGSVHEVIG